MYTYLYLALVVLLTVFIYYQLTSPSVFSPEKIERKMKKFYEKRLPLGLPISREEIIKGVFRGREVPLMVKDEGRLVFLKTGEWHNGWSARVFKDGKMFRSPTPEEFRKKYEDFKARKVVESPFIKEELFDRQFDGVGVSEVGDLCWWPNIDRSCVLIAATLEDGKNIIIGYEDGAFSLLSSSKGEYQLVLSNLQYRPSLELDDDHINIHFAKNRQLLVHHSGAERCGWNARGFGWSGSAACKKFAEHGMSFSAESGKE